MTNDINHKILVIDDSPAIHEDFKKILVKDSAKPAVDSAKAAFLGSSAPAAEPEGTSFEMHSAHQGQEGLAMLKEARAAGQPFAMAFVDVRMPPGWDGVRTIEEMWAEDSELEVVMCTAYSDYSWNETLSKLGSSDQLLILKKPFDPVEICQLASALTAKWSMRQRERTLLAELTRKEQEARAYASSLETVNRALESSKAMSERSDHLKNDFIAQLSGAIHASVTGILESAVHACSDASGENLQSVENLLTSSRRVLSSLDELGTLAELDAGRMTFTAAEDCPRTIAEETVEELRPLAQAKGITLEFIQTDPDVSITMLDHYCLKRALSQLLRNGIEHTSEGSVTLSMGTRATSNWKEQLLLFEVQDTGSGIAPEHQATIFEPFYNSREDNDARGTGLGLTVVKRLASLMRAEVSVRSTPGSGSCFSLTLPLPKVSMS
ncbi:MAG: two-component system sensor histidine kinase/response regulator [Planctomycetota bacterium]|jgi:two-component system sensor histidine kinase/response regulator